MGNLKMVYNVSIHTLSISVGTRSWGIRWGWWCVCVCVFVGGGGETPTLHFAYMTIEIFDTAKLFYICECIQQFIQGFVCKSVHFIKKQKGTGTLFPRLIVNTFLVNAMLNYSFENLTNTTSLKYMYNDVKKTL